MRKCKYPRPPHEHLRGASFQKNNHAGACNRADQRSLWLPDEVLVRGQEETRQLRLNAVAQARLLKRTVRQNRPAPAGGSGDGGRHYGQRGKTMSNQQKQTSGNANRNVVAAPRRHPLPPSATSPDRNVMMQVSWFRARQSCHRSRRRSPPCGVRRHTGPRSSLGSRQWCGPHDGGIAISGVGGKA